MGGAQSTPTRKLTIPNEESNIIKVSESVAERLRRCAEKSPEEFMKNQEDMAKKSKELLECPPTELDIDMQNKVNTAYYPGDPLLNFYYGPSVTSIRILQAKERELKESEDYWTKRIYNMEKHHEKLNDILETEYKKAVDEISAQSPRPPPNSPFPCCEQRNKLLECYKKNPNEILLCAGEVTEFADCVHSKRLQTAEEAAEEKERERERQIERAKAKAKAKGKGKGKGKDKDKENDEC